MNPAPVTSSGSPRRFRRPGRPRSQPCRRPRLARAIGAAMYPPACGSGPSSAYVVFRLRISVIPPEPVGPGDPSLPVIGTEVVTLVEGAQEPDARNGKQRCGLADDLAAD